MTEQQQAAPAYKVGAIHKAIVAVMKSVGSVGKNKTSDSSAGSYKYRGIDDIYNAINPAFAEHGVFTTNEILRAEHVAFKTAGGKDGTECRLTTRWFFWAEDGSWVSIDSEGVGRDTQDKAANKAMAAAHKYALVQILALPTAEPKDSEDSEIDINAEERRDRERSRQQERPPTSRPAQAPQQRPPAGPPAARPTPAPAQAPTPAPAKAPNPAPAAPTPAPSTAMLEPTEIQALNDAMATAADIAALGNAWSNVMAQQKKIAIADMKKLRSTWQARETALPATAA